jgi:hypothetical protein
MNGSAFDQFKDNQSVRGGGRRQVAAVRVLRRAEQRARTTESLQTKARWHLSAAGLPWFEAETLRLFQKENFN